ncbi:uncharacterized protein LOC111874023 [Cryptotermes secundus]|uniref:uncharacterized protein LOC111874023 n=1 Tax=Cryptotermes secundus TaxID=105785 RepID=UPI000CD7BD0E|nr:uncharacterized protein LOC111874023 [Cryptotermes secundus]
MPKRKQPCKLQALVMLRVVKLLRKACESWITALREAALTGSEAYLKETQNVTADCDTVYELLTSLPTDILQLLATHIIRRIINMIAQYDETCCELKDAFWYDEDYHDSVCSKILNAVLFPCTRVYYMKDITSGFAQKLIVQTLACVPNLTVLTFDLKTENDNSNLVASNIHHLRHLKSFQYNCDCTDEVVEQVALHCRNLRTVILSFSHSVTDASVHYLMTLNKLEHVDVMFTSITTEFYGALLSVLPSINNIVITSLTYNIFEHILKEELYTITQYTGYIRDINVLTQKCPNLSTVVMYDINQNLANMVALNRLDHLQIRKADYESCNLNAVLIGVGHRLCHLYLVHIKNVRMVEIVNFCSSLECLLLKRCSFVRLNENGILGTDPPHYRSVTDLKLLGDSHHEIDFRHLQHYVNLQILECTGVNTLNDDFIEDAVRQGAFRNIVCFKVEEIAPGALTMRTVELLIRHCEHLKELGYLRSWRLVEPEFISNLRNIIVTTNSDLHIL